MGDGTAKRPLDEFDLTLIRELEIDARKTSLELASTLGTSHTTVRRRLQNLLDEGIISFVTIAHPRALGYLTLALIGVNVRPGKRDVVAARITALECSQMVTTTAGQYDLLATIVIKDLEDLMDFISKDLGSIKDITGTETMIILKVFKNSWSYMGVKECIMNRNLTKSHLDEIDISLIRELELEPRETISQLAKKLNTNRSNVSRRMQTLLDRGVIRIMSVPDLSSLGYTIWTMLQLKVDPSKIAEIVEELCLYPNVAQVIMTTGRFEMAIAAAFKDRDEMYNFIENKLGRTSGVVKQETLMILKNYKRSFSLPNLRSPHQTM